MDTAVQSAAAHITMQLGPALFSTLLHGNAKKTPACETTPTTLLTDIARCLSILCALVGDRSANFGPLEENARGVFPH